jgi:hypothetical protein
MPKNGAKTGPEVVEPAPAETRKALLQAVQAWRTLHATRRQEFLAALVLSLSDGEREALLRTLGGAPAPRTAGRVE